jgi:hypothetical protein
MKTAITVNPRLNGSIERQAKRLLTINGFSAGEYNPHRVKAWLIHNEVYYSFIAIGSSEQEAIDNCVDSNLWDHMKMSDEDLQEYEENGWDDSFIRAGNASEAFWSENLFIEEIGV